MRAAYSVENLLQNAQPTVAKCRVRLCVETTGKSYFKRFLDIEKVHRNSIKITVDFWSEC